jgi:hypothetical protein
VIHLQSIARYPQASGIWNCSIFPLGGAGIDAFGRGRITLRSARREERKQVARDKQIAGPGLVRGGGRAANRADPVPRMPNELG